MSERTVDDCSVILTTVASESEAARIAEALVAELFAACVQWQPIMSCYRWQGAVERAAEVRLQVKTAPARAEAALARLRALHPYDLPEVVMLHGHASTDYAAWVAAETRAEE